MEKELISQTQLNRLIFKFLKSITSNFDEGSVQPIDGNPNKYTLSTYYKQRKIHSIEVTPLTFKLFGDNLYIDESDAWNILCARYSRPLANTIIANDEKKLHENIEDSNRRIANYRAQIKELETMINSELEGQKSITNNTKYKKQMINALSKCPPPSDEFILGD